MLETIIDFQNAKFENLSYFSKVFGRAELVTVNDKLAPYHYIGNGEYVPVSDFDLYGGSIYWRKNGQVSVADISSTSLIGSRKLVEVSMPMRIIVTVPKGKLSGDDAYSSERVANTLIRTIQENNSTLKTALSARKIIFEIEGWEDEPQKVKAQEYSGRDMLPDWVYLSMDINVVVEADASCLSTECEYYVTRCEILNKLVTAEDRRTCILPEFDFSTDADYNALSDTQEGDLEDRLCGVTIQALTCAELNNSTSGLTIAQRNQIQIVKDVKTGQTTSYRTGDDGEVEYGRQSSFSVLSCNNPFGNTNRFTDELGGQTYTNNLVIDWATGLMWYRVVASGTWNQAIDAAVAATNGGYTDWLIPNRNEAMSISYMGTAGHLNYSPFNINVSASGEKIWTSTTSIKNTATAYTLSDTNDQIEAYPKSLTVQYIYCRYFTLTDLGL